MPNQNDDGLSDLLGEKPSEVSNGNGAGRSPSPEQKADAASAKAAEKSEEETGKTGYLGNGRYRRKDGIVERVDVYLSPEQAKALRVAAATRDDPNGTSVSEIVGTLIEKAGYS